MLTFAEFCLDESFSNWGKAINRHVRHHIRVGNPAFKDVAKLMGKKMGPDPKKDPNYHKHLAKMRSENPHYGKSAAEGGPKVFSKHGLIGAHVEAIKKKKAYFDAQDARNK